MSQVSIRLSPETATFECEKCGRTLSVTTTDRSRLLSQVREFLSSHAGCVGR